MHVGRVCLGERPGAQARPDQGARLRDPLHRVRSLWQGERSPSRALEDLDLDLDLTSLPS